MKYWFSEMYLMSFFKHSNIQMCGWDQGSVPVKCCINALWRSAWIQTDVERMSFTAYQWNRQFHHSMEIKDCIANGEFSEEQVSDTRSITIRPSKPLSDANTWKAGSTHCWMTSWCRFLRALRGPCEKVIHD